MNSVIERLARRASTARPRPATVIALLALVMAMGGTSVAGSLISGTTLKNGSVSRNKIAKNAIDDSRLAAKAVTADKLAAGAVSWKSLGAQVVAATPVTLSTTGLPLAATATCPAGTVAISGGETFSDPAFAFVVQSVQAGLPGAQAGLPGAAPTGWTVTGATGGQNTAQMTVYAICISAGT